MFNNLDPKNKDIDDIFADTDAVPTPAASASSPSQPAVSPMPAAIKNPAISAMPTASDLGEEVSTKTKMGRVLKKLFIFIIILALVGAAAYFIYAKFLLNSTSNLQQEATKTPSVPVVQTSTTPVTTTTPATTTTATTTSLDLDNDGLSDIEETVLGTDSNNVDTDGDGLSDGDEVKKYLTSPILKDTDTDGLTDGEEVNTYKTNPNNPDTDGDTYLDGSEVKAGYDPLVKPVK
jgi:hypothetical protein